MNYELIENFQPKESSCLVLGFFSDSRDVCLEKSLGKVLEPEEKALVGRLCKRRVEAGEWAWQEELRKDCAALVINCGLQAEFDSKQLKKRLKDIVEVLLNQGMTSAILALPPISNSDADGQLEQMVLQIDSDLYQLHDYKTIHKKTHVLKSVQFILKDANPKAIEMANAIASAITFTKTLANLPANHCTPSILGERAKRLGQELDNVSVRTFGTKEQQELGMGGLLGVSQGSAEPACFIEMSYLGGKTGDKPIVLIGKGITFDSGGLSLKPADMMVEMKYDMCGAATVLGVIKAAALLKLPINVIGLIASAENMPSGTAIKPGDIITTMSGQTVEVLNTDAEGRLVLADALTYAERFNPRMVIDIATLTGAVIVALGNLNTGLMTTDDELADLIIQIGKESNDSCWRLPLEEDYQSALDSPLADMINAAFDRTAGSVTAACFLSRFSKKYRWAHLDIAGTGWISGKNRQATGRPVPLLVHLLRHEARSR